MAASGGKCLLVTAHKEKGLMPKVLAGLAAD
jgi:hypothetical protein